MIPFEIIAFLVGHITGWGEGVQEITMSDLLTAGFASGLISLILTAVVGFVTPLLGIDPVTTIAGPMTDIASISLGAITSGIAGLVGTYWGYFARMIVEQLQDAY